MNVFVGDLVDAQHRIGIQNERNNDLSGNESPERINRWPAIHSPMAQSTASKRDTVKSIINDILREKEGASPVETLSDDISLTKDLGLDSLHLAEMTVHLEDKYNVDVFAEDVPNTVGDVLEKL